MTTPTSSVVGAIRASFVAEDIPVLRALDAISDWSFSNIALVLMVWPNLTYLPRAKWSHYDIIYHMLKGNTWLIKFKLSSTTPSYLQRHSLIKIGISINTLFFILFSNYLLHLLFLLSSNICLYELKQW